MTSPSELASMRVARTALRTAGLASDDLELVRIGTNAVYRTPSAVVRVADRDYDQALLKQQIDLSVWLVDVNFPTAALLWFGVVDSAPVTIWRRITQIRTATTSDLAELARHFHDVTEQYGGDLPQWEPLGRLGVRLDQMSPDSVLTPQALADLRSTKDALVARAHEMSFELQQGPIHGDMHTGNIVVNDYGPHLVDFDWIARGPREWDLVKPLASVRLFGSGEDSWREFIAIYGFDVTQWSGCEDLLLLRGLFMMSWLLTLERTPAVADEIAARLPYFLDSSKPYTTWVPV